MSEAKKSILIVSSCSEDWGGSEELWAKSIPFFKDYGYKINVLKSELNFSHPKFIELKNSGVKLIQLKQSESRVSRIVKRNWKKILTELGRQHTPKDIFKEQLLALKPSFVVISQGINFDGLGYGCVCAKLSIPYFIVCQKAVDFYWPNYFDRGFMTDSLIAATKCFFVSQHNKTLTEEQFGLKLTNAEVVYNPVKLKREVIAFPDSTEEIRMACIGRLFLLDKGQDMLIRIMSRDKWRNRNISISFYGEGVDKTGLMAMVDFYQLKNIRFEGYTEDISSVWHHHHALILPSRSEGMPLVMLESMSVGRICIVSNAGGNAEIIENNKTGFVGASCEEGIEEAMERAWQNVHRWEDMGKAASLFINQSIPEKPEQEFVNAIINSL